MGDDDDLQVIVSRPSPDTGMTLDKFCPQAQALGFSGILKHRDLDAWRQACR